MLFVFLCVCVVDGVEVVDVDSYVCMIIVDYVGVWYIGWLYVCNVL